ncbi:MAG: hypothetical protein KDD89_05420 [Anaerolineales bacterium]|nr:hypothetical protein [Anaerolineales bacterium]
MSQKRLEHEIELQSRQIKRVLAQHHVEAELANGRVDVDVEENKHGRRVSFNVRAKLAAGWQQAQALARDLQQTLEQEVLVEDEDGQLKINLFQRQRPPVELLDVLEMVPDVPTLTAVLGWTAADRPLWLDFTSPDAQHVLLAGQSGAGKTSLLRTIALSLALHNRERELQLAIISVSPDEVPLRKRQDLQPLGYLPHMLSPIATNQPDAQQLLAFLGQETAYRQANDITQPHIVLLVDHTNELLWQGGPPALEALTRLVRQGAPAGIHVVLGVDDVETAVLEDLLDANLPARLVGQMTTAVAAEIATDVYESGAEQLAGEGDFLAVLGELMVHFQAAFASDYDLHLCLEHLYTQRPPALIAQTFNPRPRPYKAPADPQTYTFTLSSNTLHEAEEPPPAEIPVNRLSRHAPPLPAEKPITEDPAPKQVPEPITQAESPSVPPAVSEMAAPELQEIDDLDELDELDELDASDDLDLLDIMAEMAIEEIPVVEEQTPPPAPQPKPVNPPRQPQPAPTPPTRVSAPMPEAKPAPEPLVPPTHWPWADDDTAEEDEIPFDWLAVDPIAEPLPTEAEATTQVAVAVEEKPVSTPQPAEPEPPAPAVNPAVRNLLNWRKRLPTAPSTPPRHVVSLRKPKPDNPSLPLENSPETASPEAEVTEDAGIKAERADTAVVLNLAEIAETEDDEEGLDFDILSEFSSADELKWLDELDEIGDGAENPTDPTRLLFDEQATDTGESES